VWAIANSLPEEMPVYKQMKIRFMKYVHLKVPHDTPPLRGFGSLVSAVLQLRGSRPSNLVLRKPGFRPLLAPISPGWTPGLGSFLGKSSALATTHIPSVHHSGRLITHRTNPR
jgi:hypothetical protein